MKWQEQAVTTASQEHQAQFSAPAKASEALSPEDRIERLRAYVDVTLSPEVREALELDYGWHEAAAEPRAWFRLESLGGLVRCAIWFSHRDRRWQVFLPHPYHPQLTLWDREPESELLGAITDFWNVEGIVPRSSVSSLLDREEARRQETECPSAQRSK